MPFSRRFVAVLVVMAVVSSTAHADVLFVDNCTGPGGGTDGVSFSSIQAAIDAAVDGDEVVVAPCTYFENINFLGKAICLRSSNGSEVTTIDALGMGRVVTCISGEGPDTILDGFTITGGNTGGLGGGMLNQGSSPTLTNCNFTGNQACPISGAGGGMANLNGSPTVTDCAFTDNLAGLFGGGMVNFNSSPTVTNCTFSGNTSNNKGGGMTNGSGSAVVTDCTFTGNTALGGGGGMSNGAGSSPILTNCILDGNTAGEGGGAMHNFGSSPTLINCTFTRNLDGPVGAGGIFNDGFNSSVTLVVLNCVFWDNFENQIREVGENSDTTVLYTNIQGGWPGLGNINALPMFVDPDNGDLRLQPASPCIDAGDNTAVPQDIVTDLDGNPRFLEIPETPDTGLGELPIVDMGVFEALGGGCLAVTSQQVVCHADGTTFTINIEGLNACTGGTTQVTFTASGGSVGEQLCFTTLVNDGGFCCSTEICVTIPDCTPAGLPSDLDGDGIVGMVDFLALLGAWGTCSDCGAAQACPADFDGDCSVDIHDLLVLLGSWTG
ncbi:MAG: hypothetical protein E2O40_01570 [Planctomycetota bacterium]|nr:MAG: hypothetical protein E2O40_01570 [Planctomycetota bacterium]